MYKVISLVTMFGILSFVYMNDATAQDILPVEDNMYIVDRPEINIRKSLPGTIRRLATINFLQDKKERMKRFVLPMMEGRRLPADHPERVRFNLEIGAIEMTLHSTRLEIILSQMAGDINEYCPVIAGKYRDLWNLPAKINSLGQKNN